MNMNNDKTNEGWSSHESGRMAGRRLKGKLAQVKLEATAMATSEIEAERKTAEYWLGFLTEFHTTA
jgi:hypothetical protein